MTTLIDQLEMKPVKQQVEASSNDIVESSLDSLGICPHCNEKMETATCARKQVFLCEKDRVVLPIIEEGKDG